MRSSSPFMSTFATEMVVRGHRSLREVRWFFRNRLVEVACLFARYWLFLIVFYCWRINIFPIRMFSSVRSSDCDSDRILESNQKNSKNQSIHLFRLLGGGKEGASDCLHSNGFYLSRLVWMYFRYDPWNDTTSWTSSDTKSRDNKKKTPLNITQNFDLIALCDRKTISREGEYWDYLIIICKIRTRS